MPDLSRHAAAVATFALLTAPAWAAGVLELLGQGDEPSAPTLCASAESPCAPPASAGGPLRVSAGPAARPPRASASASPRSAA